jgi:GH43 family beta-xylosidase
MQGLISELEVYSMDGTKEFGLPEVDTLSIE